MNALVRRSRERFRESVKLVERSRDLIAVSRRALNPAWQISGSADAEPRPGRHPNLEALRLAIRRRLRQDTLFPAPSRVWSGAGRGRFCIVCDRDISAHEIETEMILGPVTLWAHLPCYLIWREESIPHDDTSGVPLSATMKRIAGEPR